MSLLGYSWGGVLSITYTAINSKKIKNLIFYSVHVDFGKDDSILAQWIKNFPIDKYASKFDAINSRLINHAFLMRNPVSHFFDNIQYALDMDSNFFEYLASITAWLNNTIDISTEFFKQFTTDLYQRNLLIRNEMNIGSATNIIDLGKYRCHY